MIRELFREYEEISIVLGVLFLLFASPLLHESFHQLYLKSIRCAYRETVLPSIPISAVTEPLCDMSQLQNISFLLAGITGSLITAEVLYLVARKSGPVFSVPIQSLSSSILLSNALMLLQKKNDLSILGMPVYARAIVFIILAFLGIFQFAEIVRVKEKSAVHSIV